jgi:DNA-binding NarL/FixJ family response regulator
MTPAPVLTERQKSVLSMFADGYDVQQIAVYLRLPSLEVRRIMRDCLVRLGVKKSADAVERAREMGLILTGGVVA